jgi:hypothetical protein
MPRGFGESNQEHGNDAGTPQSPRGDEGDDLLDVANHSQSMADPLLLLSLVNSGFPSQIKEPKCEQTQSVLDSRVGRLGLDPGRHLGIKGKFPVVDLRRSGRRISLFSMNWC